MASSQTIAIYDIDDFGVKHRLSSHSAIATHVSACLRIAIGILNSRKGMNALAELALQLDDTLDDRWYRRIDGYPHRAKRLIDKFLDVIEDRFPYIYLEPAMTDLGNLAKCWRIQWEGDFNPRKQIIQLHEQVRCSSMFTNCKT